MFLHCPVHLWRQSERTPELKACVQATKWHVLEAGRVRDRSAGKWVMMRNLLGNEQRTQPRTFPSGCCPSLSLHSPLHIPLPQQHLSGNRLILVWWSKAAIGPNYILITCYYLLLLWLSALLLLSNWLSSASLGRDPKGCPMGGEPAVERLHTISSFSRGRVTSSLAETLKKTKTKQKNTKTLKCCEREIRISPQVAA